MQDQPQTEETTASAEPGFFDKLRSFFKKEPTTAEEFSKTLKRAHGQKIIDTEAFTMMEGALKVGHLCASDLMVPRAQIEAVDLEEPREVWLPKVISRGHSRFPVIEGDLDEV